MKSKSGLVCFLSCLTLAIVLSTPAAAAVPQAASAADLFTNVVLPPSASTTLGPTVVRQTFVTIEFDKLRETLPTFLGGAQTAQSLALNLFPNTRFVAVLSRVEPTGTGYVWVGTLQGVDFSAVRLAVTRNTMAASITTPAATYSIRHVENGVHVVQEINLSAFPAEAPPVTPNLPAEAPPAIPNRPEIGGDDGSLIDVLVVYTPAARIAQGGTSSIEALIDLGISETNQAYTNSGVVQRLRLVRKEETAYTESGSMSTDLGRLQNPSDGFLDSVQTLRNTYSADIVQLVENSGDFCGIAYLMTNVSTSFAPNAFGITHYSCISPNYSFGHEMGHNMGLRHDTYVDTGSTPYPYSHGYVNQAALVPGAATNKRWRDVMAYNDQCAASGFNCPRILYFSTPLKTYTSDILGNANTADATRSLDDTRVVVSNFRTTTGPTVLTCDVQLNKTSFVNNEQVTAQVLRVINPTANALAVQYNLWFEAPAPYGSVPFLRAGDNGSVVFNAGFNQDFGPMPLFTVNSSLPRGNYAFNCRFLDPVTGAIKAEDLNPFTVN